MPYFKTEWVKMEQSFRIRWNHFEPLYTLWSWETFRKLLSLNFTHEMRIIMKTAFRILWRYICTVFGKLIFNIIVNYIYIVLTKPLILSTLHHLSMWKVLLPSPFHRKGNRGTKKWKDLAKVMLIPEQPGLGRSSLTFLPILL